MKSNFSGKRFQALFTFIILTAFAMATLTSANTPQVNAQTNSILTITGYDGTTKNYTLSDLQNLPSVSGYGGYYQPNQNQVNNGNWTGVSLYYLCNQTSGITSTCNVSVIGQGTNDFSYEMVANGTNLNLAYKTYNNLTGAAQNQTQPVTLLLAYQVNSTDLPSSIAPAPRLVIIGPEGLLMIGTGGRSITQINIIDTSPTPTLTPTQIPSATSTPSATPTLISSPTPIMTATPTVTPTQIPTPTQTTPTATPTPQLSPTETPTVSATEQPTASPTATLSASPEPNETEQSTVLYIAITVVVIIIAAIAIAVAFKRRK